MTALEKAVDTFKRTFMTSEGHLLVKDVRRWRRCPRKTSRSPR